MFKSSNDAKLEEEIAFSLKELETHREDPEKYAAVIDRITKLDKLKSEGFSPPSLDTVLIVGANIFGILWLTRFEKENVITSKAINFVLKPR
jgi:hypothetical protein